MKNWNPVETAPINQSVFCVLGTKASGPMFACTAKLKPFKSKNLWLDDISLDRLETDGYQVQGWLPIPELI